ncbi:MAG: sugar phosphate isomerase/epimerase [Verrucomicrobiales bacterium]|nr:sugar phosphate isomerase/epimerase [Verrucomicrobiales bacterium]
MNRRKFCHLLAASSLVPTVVRSEAALFKIRYTLSSAMYGDLPLEEVLAEVKNAGAESVDIWRKKHATHREQIEEIGDEAFQSLLTQYDTRMAVSTCYPLGPFKQDDEIRWVNKNGGNLTVCGSGRMGKINDPVGAEAKSQVKAFFEKLKPHYELAEEMGITMAIENHKNSMLSSPDSIRYFAEMNPSKNVGVAFAPHHLHDAIEEIPKLISELGAKNIPFVYFQEYHPSSKKTMSKVHELKQMPGFGSLDYLPILAALRDIKFNGIAEIFMHPTPRGIPMLPTAKEITWAINQSRAYLDDCLKSI